MFRKLSYLFVLASLAAACGTEGPDASGPASEGTVNALEASGQVEFFVKIVGANGSVFRGESNNAFFRDSIPAIRYYSDVNKSSSAGATHCTAFRFTKAAGASSPQLAASVASGETLQSVHFDFVKNSNFIWQQVDLTGVRTSMVEQAVSPPDNLSASVVLEEATLVPVSTATVKLTAIPQLADGSAGAAIVSTFTCKP
jgi:type VI protein secretion system component Hcp